MVLLLLLWLMLVLLLLLQLMLLLLLWWRLLLLLHCKNMLLHGLSALSIYLLFVLQPLAGCHSSSCWCGGRQCWEWCRRWYLTVVSCLCDDGCLLLRL